MPIGDTSPFNISGQFDPGFLASLNLQTPGASFFPSPFGLANNAGMFNLGGFGGSSLSGGFGGNFSLGGGGTFLDTQTGNIVSAAQAQQIDPGAWQQFLGSQQATMSPNTPMLQPPGAPSPTQGGGSGGFNLGSLLPSDPKTGNIDWTKTLGGGAALLAAGGGLAGIIQALSQGGQTSKTVNQFPSPTAQQTAAQQQGLQNLQGAGQFAFGPSGAFGGGGGIPPTRSQPQGTVQPQYTAPEWMRRQIDASFQGGAPRLPNSMITDTGSPWGSPTASAMQLWGQGQGNQAVQMFGPPPGGDPTALLQQQVLQQQNAGGWGGLAGVFGSQQPFLNAALRQALQQQAGQIGGNPFLGQQIPQQLAGQVGGYGGAQGSLLGLQGLGAANLGPQIAGTGARALQGNLPPLSPELMGIINRVYAGGEAAIQSEADTAFKTSLEHARQQGFAGGAEVFRQGTPQALLAPSLERATDQRAELEGERARTVFNLMQGLPQLGGQLATQGQGLLGQAAGAYTTPLSVSLQGGQNLAGLNQNVIQSLLNAGYGGLGLQNQFLGALGGQTGAAGALSNAFQPLGSTQMQTQPFNLLSAMAPTANLLGGLGGLFTAMNPRPQINFQLPGGTTA